MTDSGIVKLGARERRGLDIEGLERDLSTLWKTAGAESAGAVARACLATLVVPVEGEGTVDDLLEDITRIHPSRMLIVRLGGKVPAGTVEAWVSATCSRRPGEQTMVCAESITLEMGEGTEGLLAGTVRSLAVGGVPGAVLSERIPFSRLPWVNALGRSIDFALGDSAHYGVAQALDLWRGCRGADGAGPQRRDLVWTRLMDWRRALAMGFDTPERAGRLGSLREVRIDLAEDPSALPGAALLAGWLRTRLNWGRVRGKEPGGAIRFQNGGAPVDLVVTRSEAGDDPARIRSVEFSFSDGAPDMKWERLSSERAIQVTEAVPGGLSARLNRTKTSRASAVVQELHHRHADPLALEAMLSAADVLPLLEDPA